MGMAVARSGNEHEDEGQEGYEQGIYYAGKNIRASIIRGCKKSKC